MYIYSPEDKLWPENLAQERDNKGIIDQKISKCVIYYTERIHI